MLNFKKHLPLANPLYWPAWTGLALLWFITRLPYRWQLNIGKGLGKFLFFFPSKLKQITLVNIQLCFPQLNSCEQKNLARKNFASIGIGLIEAALAWWMPDDKLQQLFNVS